MDLWWAYIVLGLVAGVFGAALGVGGGIIMVPALVIFFGVAQKPAQGASLAAMTLMAFVAALRYWADPATRMDLKVVGLISIFAMVGAVAGVEIARRVSAGVLQKAFAVVMVIAAVRLAFFTNSRDRGDRTGRPAVGATAAPGKEDHSR